MLRTELSSKSRGCRGSLLIVPFLALLGACSGSDDPADPATGNPSPSAAQFPQVGIVLMHREEVALTAEIAGRVAASQTAEIRPQVNGIVIERVFREGSEVATGDVLYRLDPKTYEANVASAEATLKRAEAGQASAQARLQRYNNLSGNSVISTAERDDAEVSYLQAQADVSVAQAALDTARISLDYTTITAPVAGLIGTAAVNAGSLVTANQADALATLRQIDPIYVDFSEASGSLLNFRTQMENGSIRTLVGPDRQPEVSLTLANGAAYGEIGTIDFAEQVVRETTGTFIIRSSFANPDRILLPGMYVRGQVSLAVADNGFLVPQRAVTRNPAGEATAMILNGEGVVETRVLDIMMDIGPDWLATGGLSDGDRLIVDGLQRVRDGQQATAVEVMIDANGIVRPADADAAVTRAEGEATNLSTTANEPAAD